MSGVRITIGSEVASKILAHIERRNVANHPMVEALKDSTYMQVKVFRAIVEKCILDMLEKEEAPGAYSLTGKEVSQ